MKARFELTEKDYRYLFENASDAMWVQNMEGTIVDANKACEKLSGYAQAELLGKNVREFVAGEALELAREIRRQLLNGQEIDQPYEQRLVRKDGSRGVMRMATSLLVIDGQPVGFQHVARDITEEKLAGEMLYKIINGSPIPSFVINKKHEVTHWNVAIESLSGIKGNEMVGTDEQWRQFYTSKRPTMADLIVDGVSPDEIEAHYKGKCRKSNLIDDAYEAEDFFPSLGDHGKWLLFTASPIKSEDGEIIGAIETLQDITEEKLLQENMRYYVQLITKAQEEERKRIARELHDEASLSLLLLTQGLDTIISASRPRPSKLLKERLESLRSRAVEALELLRRFAQELRPRILDDLGLIPALEWMAEDMGKTYQIKTRVKVTGTERVLPDEAQLLLFRISQEALSNIRRHAEASKARIKLSFEDDNITMTVKDNGKGFEVPQQIEDLASIGRLGIIGMAERARLLNGTLKITSEAGKGTQVVAKLWL